MSGTKTLQSFCRDRTDELSNMFLFSMESLQGFQTSQTGQQSILYCNRLKYQLHAIIAD